MISEWEGLLDKLQIFEKMYQTMRLVDPVAKKVLRLVHGELHGEEHACYDLWTKDMICENNCKFWSIHYRWIYGFRQYGRINEVC